MNPISQGVNLFGYFKSPIGLGAMTRGLARALKLKGVEVSRNVVGHVAMEDVVPADFVRRYDHHQGTNIFVSYPHLHENLLLRQPEERVRHKRNVVYLAWEQRDGCQHWGSLYEDFDDLWALSTFAATSLERATGREVRTVPCALELDTFPETAERSSFGIDDDAFVFLYVFDADSSIERKNPEGVIRAYEAAFAGSSRTTLIVKVSNPHRPEHRRQLSRLVDLAAACRGHVQLLTEDLSRPRVLGLIAVSDVYVSLHRAEGFGLTCAEAMAYGKPVIASRYSGNLDFMTPENSYLVDCDEIEVSTPEGPFMRGSVWGDPDPAHAAHLMRHVFEHRGEAAAVGARGRETVRRRFSVQAVAEQVAQAQGRL